MTILSTGNSQQQSHSAPRGHALNCLAIAALMTLAGCGGSSEQAPPPAQVLPEAPIVAAEYLPNAHTHSVPMRPPRSTTLKSSDASTGIALGSQWMLVADDESNVLRVYPRAGGAAVVQWDYALEGPKLGKELDAEASVKIGDRVYLIGSHSNKKDGADVPAERGHLIAFDLSGEGPATKFSYVGKFSSLEAQMISWDTSNQHGRGVKYFGFANSAGAGIAPERTDGFSIEGMTTSPDGTALWLGFRAPLGNGAARSKALVLPVRNHAALISGSATQADFGAPIELDLGGRGIRSIDKGTDGKYLILAGPAAGASSLVDRNFALYYWSGLAAEAAVELNNQLEPLRGAHGGSFEAIVEVAGPVAGGTSVQLLTDNGDTVWAGKSVVSKDLPAAEHKFQGFTLKLGSVLFDTTGPVLKAASPADDRLGVPVNSQLVLSFNEAIKWGGGKITLRKADGTAVEAFDSSSAAARAQVNYNELVLDPSADLDRNTAYYVTIDGNAVTDLKGNAYAGFSSATALNFVSAEAPTALAIGDVLFMAANADVPDAIAFVILKNISGGTQIVFSDRDFKNSLATANGGNGFFNISNEGVFVWTADRNLPAGTIVTILTDSAPLSPVADIGTTVGAPAGMGKEEIMYAMVGTVVDGLAMGSAGKITQAGTMLASITIGGAGTPGTRDIPAALTAAGTAMDFSVTPANQTNAMYTGSLDRSNLAAFALRVKDKANWTIRNTVDIEDGFTLTNGSLFPAK